MLLAKICEFFKIQFYCGNPNLSETKDFYNFLQGKTGLKQQMLRFGGLEVAEIQSFALLNNVAHENLLKELLSRGQENGFESSLVLFNTHSSAGLNSSAQAHGTGRKRERFAIVWKVTVNLCCLWLEI